MPRLQTLLTAILAGGCLIAHATAQTPTDACAAAPAINNGTYSFSTVGATDDGPADSCSSTVGSDVWFRYTPVCAGSVSINTCGSNFNTNLDVFNACPSGGGTIVACNDDNPICGGGQLRNRSSLSFNAAGEITYWIRVSGNASDGPAQTGSVVLVVQGPCADAVSYQGRLVSAGKPVNGAVNLQFQLFDAPSDGFPIGPVVEKSNITATDGLVSTLLDFGPGVFVAPRWLQIAVNDPARASTLSSSITATSSPPHPAPFRLPTAASAASSSNPTSSPRASSSTLQRPRSPPSAAPSAPTSPCPPAPPS